MTYNTNTNDAKKNSLKSLLGLVFIFLFFSLANIPVLQTIWENSFDDGTYSHAYLIPIISMYLYYQLAKTGQLFYRDKLAILPLIMLFFSTVIFSIMVSAQINLGYWAATLAILLSSVLLIYRANWQVFFPTLFLAFLMPGWGLLTVSLQKISISAVSFLMSYTGIPTFVEGNLVTIPAGVFEIADGCSGLRYLIVSLAISSLFSFLYIKKIRNAVLFFSVAILGALITNWIRITALILIGEYTNMESDLMTDHNMFGWYLYVPFMFLLFMWGNKLADNDQLLAPTNTNNNTVARFKARPALANTLLFLVLVTITSSSLKAILVESSTSNTSPQEIPETFPIVKNFGHVEQTMLQTGKSQTLYLKYFFNGALSGGKPTDFTNQYIPVGWHEVARETFENWQYITVVRRNEASLIRISFEVNNTQTPSANAFKKQRIIAALTGTSESYLHWQFMTCSTTCKQETAILKELN